MNTAPAPISIVPARREHVPEIVVLLADDILGGARESTSAEARADYERAFDAIQHTPSTTLYVMLDGNGSVLGTFQLTLTPGLSLRGTTCADIEAVRVASSMRGRGLGESMMRFAIAQARAAGAGLIQISSNSVRTDAHRFYERLGFTRSHSGFKMKV